MSIKHDNSLSIEDCNTKVAAEVDKIPSQHFVSKRVGKLTIKGLKKSFDQAVVYDGFDLELPLGSFISVFGPNGCGKSTLINMISGLMPMDEGEVLYDGKTIAETRISYVIHYPLKLMGVPKLERDKRIESLIADFGIKIDLNAYPYQLSGGQQQAVSIIRALVRNPDVLFLDEPFSALDYEMTLLMREKLQVVFEKTGTTMVLVSHDLEEAVQMADKVLLLSRRPTKVAALVENNLPRPRDANVLVSNEFVDLRRQCLDIFQREAVISEF
jgi:NitT/TauT family transport system ATP-binding protein